MTKKANRIYLIIAIAYLLVSILVPIVDYFVSKNIVFSKVEGMTSQEMQNYYNFYKEKMAVPLNDNMKYYSFYQYFYTQYVTVNYEGIVSRVYYNLWDNTDFSQVITVPPNDDGEAFYIWYILDKIFWLFIAYCIFVIPISMVDLFSKVIKKGVE